MPHFVGTETVVGVENVVYFNRIGGAWSAEETPHPSTGTQTWPTMGFQDRQYPCIVFSWNDEGTTVHRTIKRAGAWSRDGVALDSTATKTEQLYDPRIASSQTLQGSFIVFQSSIVLFVTSLIVYGDAAAASADASFTQNIHIAGRDRVNQTLSLTSVVSDPAHAYDRTIPSWTVGFTQVLAKIHEAARATAQYLGFSQNVDAWHLSVTGVSTIYKTIVHTLSLQNQLPDFVKESSITVTHTITFSAVGPGLTRNKSISDDLEFGQNVEKQMVKTVSVGPQGLTLSQVISLNKVLNLGVSQNLSFGSGNARIRAWVRNSTHWNPGWAAEYESDVMDFIIIGPTELPTISMTLPRPDYGDHDELHWRAGAIRRNRSGRAKVFKSPVYEALKYKFSGLMRKRAHEFRNIIKTLLGNNVRIRDGNGVWRDVVISSADLDCVQEGHENVTAQIAFEERDKVA